MGVKHVCERLTMLCGVKFGHIMLKLNPQKVILDISQ